MLKFLCLGSGSSGNCYYLSCNNNAILIDAGLGIRTIKKTLKDKNLPFESIRAVFVTHDHADHIKCVGVLGEKYNIPVYSTQMVHQGIRKSYCVTEKLTANHIKFIEKEETISFLNFCITAFEVPHDGTDNVGYCIKCDDKTFCFLTDLGHITSTAENYIEKADYLIMEANYEDEMLKEGPYPQYLKDRIAGPNGHMSNHDTACFLAEHLQEHLKHVWLCHLSKDNNHPELAFKAVEMEMRSHGIIIGKDLQVTPLKRTTPSDLYEL